MNKQKSTIFDELNRLGLIKITSRMEFVDELQKVRLWLEQQKYQVKNLASVKGVMEIQFLDWENLCRDSTITIEQTQFAIRDRNKRESVNFIQLELK